ncbi:MAG: DUF547 domain-containing protein [Saprospiraceae bacterium]
MTKFPQFSILIFTIFLITSCGGVKDYQSSAKPITHELWDSLVQAHVSETGKVNYKGFIKDSVQLNKYLNLIGKNHANDSWTKEQRLAYWINAYNAFTVKLIIDNYPVKSIKDIKKGLSLISTVWDIEFINIEAAKYSLGNIEHDILRKRFEEPRIHFAINCASVSCPILLNEAYTPKKLEEQLTKQSKAFINNPEKNKITANQLELSKIFKWFKGDFEKNGNRIDFLNKYAKVKINADANYDYMDYDWNLNE